MIHNDIYAYYLTSESENDMQNATYKVNMTFLAEKDVYDDGCTGDFGAEWSETREFATLAEVKEFVKDNCYSGYEYLEYDSYLKRYDTSYMTTDDNMGEMSPSELQQWKDGKINGWVVMVSVTVEKFTPKLIGNVKFN